MAKDQPSTEFLSAAARAELPYILFPDDVALRLRLEPDDARRAIRAGMLGPWILVQGEPAILRDQFKEHLRLLMVQRDAEERELLPVEDQRQRPRLVADDPDEGRQP